MPTLLSRLSSGSTPLKELIEIHSVPVCSSLFWQCFLTRTRTMLAVDLPVGGLVRCTDTAVASVKAISPWEIHEPSSSEAVVPVSGENIKSNSCPSCSTLLWNKGGWERVFCHHCNEAFITIGQLTNKQRALVRKMMWMNTMLWKWHFILLGAVFSSLLH